MKLRKTLTVLLIFFFQLIYCQEYGLRFYGQEYELDRRTGLELFTDSKTILKHSFKIDFDLLFVKDYNSYFGYIFRIVINGKTNLDLVYENKFDTLNTLNLILGDNAPLLTLNLDKYFFFNWQKIGLELNTVENSISVQVADSLYEIKNVPLNRNDNIKIFFGENSYKAYQTTDLPNMCIKDIRIFENNSLKHYWKLDRTSGETLFDNTGHAKAIVKNPFWLSQLYQQWKLARSLNINGSAQLAFNPENDELIIVSSDSMYTLSSENLSTDGVIAFNGSLNLRNGMQILYDTLEDRIICYTIDQKQISVFDPVTRIWSNSFAQIPAETQYHHHNKFLDPETNTLFIFGGYGQLTYRNEIYSVNLNTLRWDSVPNTLNIFSPRYLFGLGESGLSDTIYIVGGFGSETGDQKINPRYWYELLRYIPRSGKFEKIYSLETKRPDYYCFANSIVIDQDHQSFYGLIFSKYQFNGKLNLIRGSLQIPEYTYLADPVPYTFHDVKSYADLFYSEINRKLIAVTLFENDKNITEIHIYSILFPPVQGAVQYRNNPENVFITRKYLIPVIILVITIVAVIYLLRKKKITFKRNWSLIRSPAEVVSDESDAALIQEEVSDIGWKNDAMARQTATGRISLFGGFKAYSGEGEDITSQFTPLIVELFALILFNSLPDKSGISSNRMREILWFDKTDKDARNNQAVNIARLKALLAKIGNIKVSKETGYWKIEILSEEVYIDLFVYHWIVNSRLISKEQIIELIEITQNGSLLFNLDYDWLDEYKSDTSNHITDTLLEYAGKNADTDEHGFIIHILDVIFIFDPVNEEAMTLKCKVLVRIGKHSLAKNTYSRFCKEYKTLYGEDYSKDFNEIID